jgi:hypothetical protein
VLKQNKCMKVQKMVALIFLLVAFLPGCGECEKLRLSETNKDWISHFKEGQSFYYKSISGQTDTLVVSDTSNYFTTCNKLEVSEYQYEIYSARFKIRSKNSYNGEEPNITITTQEWLKMSPYIYFGNLGPRQNELDNKQPVAIDTILNGVQLRSVYYYSIDINAAQYGPNDYFKNFFWDKKSGLVAYTTKNDDVFLRVNYPK